jgi:hypothetical protein
MTEIIEDVRDRTASKIDLVRKLLAKAESTDSESERDALNERASQLIAAYGIDEAMLASQDESLDKITDVSVLIERPFALDFRELLAHIALPLRLRVIYSKRWSESQNSGEGGWDVTARLFGYESDIRRVQLLYPHLRNQALAGLAGITETEYGPGQAANKRTYIAGFAAAIFDRLARAEKDAKAAEKAREDALRDQALLDGTVTTSASVELVLAGRQARVEAAYAEAFPDLGKAQPRNLSGWGRDRGWRDGQKASLGTGTALGNDKKSIR